MDGTCYLSWHASSLSLGTSSLLSYRHWHLPSHVVTNHPRHLQSSINGLQLGSTASVIGFAQTLNAFRGEGASSDAIELDHQASIFLDYDFDVRLSTSTF